MLGQQQTAPGGLSALTVCEATERYGDRFVRAPLIFLILG